jgi:hypothetical protein
MEIKIGNTIITANPASDNTSVVNKHAENLLKPEVSIPQNTNSKVDITKLLKDPKLEKVKVEFVDSKEISKNSNNTKTSNDFSMDKEINKHIEMTKTIANDESALSVASSVLSAVKLPYVEPIKLTINVLNADKKKEKLAKDLECENYEGIVDNTVGMAKSSVGTAVSTAKLVDYGTDLIVSFGIASDASKTVGHIGKVTKGVTKIGSKIAIPFSVVGTALSAYDIKSAQDKINEKEKQIKKINTVSVKGCNVAVKTGSDVKELEALKTNRNLRGVAFAFSAVSTATLIKSVKDPAKAGTYVGISLATGVASSVTSALADDKVREKLKKLF